MQSNTCNNIYARVAYTEISDKSIVTFLKNFDYMGLAENIVSRLNKALYQKKPLERVPSDVLLHTKIAKSVYDLDTLEYTIKNSNDSNFAIINVFVETSKLFVDNSITYASYQQILKSLINLTGNSEFNINNSENIKQNINSMVNYLKDFSDKTINRSLHSEYLYYKYKSKSKSEAKSEAKSESGSKSGSGSGSESGSKSEAGSKSGSESGAESEFKDDNDDI